MCMVLLTRLDQGSAIALLLLVSAYETGDYIVGSGARNPYEGPVAGIAAITVITFIISTLRISVFEFTQAWIYGGAVALLAPLGQLFASALLPAAGAPASGLRRLDSLLFAAPLWCVAVGFAL
jgi:CDP-diglyceride synthetase